jgi:diacylglycerol kinase
MLRFYKSFRFALNGVIILAKTERNFKIIIWVMFAVLGLGWYLDSQGQHLNRLEWAIIWATMGLVFVSESLNTAIEKTLDTLHPDRHEGVGRAKDMAAGATLIASTVALIVGGYILLPRIMAVL